MMRLKKNQKKLLKVKYVTIVIIVFISAIIFNNVDSAISLTTTSELITKNSDEITAGFGGDVFGINYKTYLIEDLDVVGIDPKIDNADYCADLDVVNIYQRHLKSERNLLGDMVFYYNDIYNNRANRAEDFLENMGGVNKFKELLDRNIINAHNDYSIETFYNNIINKNQYWDSSL